jgi:hypothetical protein
VRNPVQKLGLAEERDPQIDARDDEIGGSEFG